MISKVLGKDADGVVEPRLFAASKDALRVWCVKSASTGSWGRAIGTLPVLNQCSTELGHVMIFNDLHSSLEVYCSCLGQLFSGDGGWICDGRLRGRFPCEMHVRCQAFALDGESGPSFAWQAHEAMDIEFSICL